MICVDIVLQRVSHKKSFQIANSNNFLSASLCLSAGVMVRLLCATTENLISHPSQLFTSLYSMLPTSQEYLTRSGFSPSAAAYTLIGLFLAGVVIIRILSGFIHRFIPSHVVDCAHTHAGPENDPERGEGQMSERDGQHQNNNKTTSTEQTPLLQTPAASSFKSTPAVLQRTEPVPATAQRESLRAILTRRISSLVGGVKPLCDEDGPCYGFSQTCGRECTKVSPPPTMSANEVTRPSLVPQPHSVAAQPSSEQRTEDDSAINSIPTAPHAGYFDTVSSQHQLHPGNASSSLQDHAPHTENIAHHISTNHANQHRHEYHDDAGPPSPTQGVDNTHHHHVPQNAFLSIGLQTSLAIALHKLPEGFITYATNHASPTLGLTVFLALFIHNIVEGFAMALPLYLALSSRWKAMFWSSLLGGISQPAGAGLAALWLWGSGHGANDSTGPSWGIYGGMFAATAGVMTSVALQLFSEGLGLTHHRGMGIGFAVAGMGLMGVSFALTA